MTPSHRSGPDGQAEIQTFLQACRTYPEHFARNPNISFKQHFVQQLDRKGCAPRQSGVEMRIGKSN